MALAIIGMAIWGNTALYAQAGVARFVNNTPFTVRIVAGSGRTEVCTLAPHSAGTGQGRFGLAEYFYPVFDVPLTAAFSLKNVRPADPNFFYQIDDRRGSASVFIDSMPVLGDNAAYIVLVNTGRTGGVSVARTASSRLSRIDSGGDNVNAGERGVFRVNPRDSNEMRIASPVNVAFPSMVYRPGYRYVYAFDGAAVALVDARPLHAIGEPSTVKTLTALPDPVDQAVAAAIPCPKAYAYRVINALLPRDNGAVIAVGGADERGGFGRTERAWLCEAEAGGGGGYSVRWELVPEDLEAGLGPARSVCYDAKRGVYRVLGEYAADDAWGGTAPASYVLDVDETGKPAGPALVLPNAVLTRIIGDAAGGAYLAGEAVEAGRSAALLVKLSGEGVVWQKQAALPRNSYYHDALFDEDENQIVAAGAADGKTGAGEGGAPFIRGVNAETGETVWHNELTAAPFGGTALVWRIEKTASGCRIVLCGIAGGVPAPPYLEASVNARGRFIEQ